MEHFDILIIGAGAAGIAAAKGAWEAGCRSIAIVDRKKTMGGILLQCAHRGFGQELTGGEYLQELLRSFPEEITVITGTTVLSVYGNKTAMLSGGRILSFDQLILAAGCREIPMGALPIGGTRPEGVYTAGQMQEMMNLHGVIPEGPAVILGSGDLGLIMAKQLAEHEIAVTLVEKKPSCGGMARNRRCLEEYPIELICNATITEVFGQKQLERVALSDNRELPCNCLLIAVGMRPEREILFGLGNPEWLHLCGNCKTVHPVVEAVIHEGKLAGQTAFEHMR